MGIAGLPMVTAPRPMIGKVKGGPTGQVGFMRKYLFDRDDGFCSSISDRCHFLDNIVIKSRSIATLRFRYVFCVKKLDNFSL
jgi:hypothetical protein